MNKEIFIHSSASDFKVFLQSGFYPGHTVTSFVHRHNYSEIHIVSDDATFAVGTETVKLKGGDALAIPKRTLHRCVSMSESAKHTAFQTSLDFPTVAVRPFSKGSVSDFINEISVCEDTSYNNVTAYISLFTTPFISDTKLYADDIRDYGFLINEFFSNRYTEDITLSDLAQLLHVSPRHAERLVREYMGESFGKELTRARIEMAEYLIKTTDMSLADIAKQVGYRSYAGFYKAMKSSKQKIRSPQ